MCSPLLACRLATGAWRAGAAGGQVLQEAYPRGSVTVAADAFLQDTTSHGAAGLWEPYKLGAPPLKRLLPLEGYIDAGSRLSSKVLSIVSTSQSLFLSGIAE